MNIALVSDAVLPFHKGGKETRIDHLSKALVALGHDVHIYTMKWWDEPERAFVADGITYHALCRLYPLYTGKRRSIREGVMFGLACSGLLFRTYDLLEVDHMPYFPLFSAKIVSLVKRKPFFATWHEAVGLQTWRHYMGYVGGTIAYLLERLSVLMPDHIVAVSARTQELIRSELHYKGQLSLVRNGIDYESIAAVPVGAVPSNIVYTGRLVKHKHVDMLIRAVARLKEDRPAIRAIIIGSGPERARLQALVKKLGLERNVTLTGRIESPADVFSYMKASKLFVSPSTREGFGITVLEAYACGLNVVTVRHQDNAAQYLVQPGAGVVCDLSVHSLAQAIAAQLDSLPGAPVDAAQFDWSHSAAALRKVYGL